MPRLVAVVVVATMMAVVLVVLVLVVLLVMLAVLTARAAATKRAYPPMAHKTNLPRFVKACEGGVAEP